MANKRQALIPGASKFISMYLASRLSPLGYRKQALGHKAGNLKCPQELGTKLVRGGLFAPGTRYQMINASSVFYRAALTRTSNTDQCRYTNGRSICTVEYSQPLTSYSCSKLEVERICHRASSHPDIALHALATRNPCAVRNFPV